MSEDGGTDVKKWLESQDSKPQTPPLTPPPALNYETKKESDVVELAKALAEAFKKVIPTQSHPSPYDRMDRFLVRQTMGKDLPQFNGEPEEWPGFIDEFKRSTEMCQFSPGENLNRLRKCLKGKAKDTVAAMLVAPENVEEVIETLRLNFGNPAYIIESLVEKARKTISPKEEKLESIIVYSNAVRNLVTTIESLKRPSYLVNPILMKEFCEKLPGSLQREWGKILDKKESADEEASLKDFSDWIVSEAKAITRIHTSSAHPSKAPTPERKSYQERPRREKTFNTTSEFPATSKPKEKKPLLKCLFCDKSGHIVNKCFDFAKESEDKRWDWAKNKMVCYSCLKSGHPMSKCEYKANCDKEGCKKQHNPLLHKSNPTVIPEEAEVQHTGLHVKLEKSVLLRILPVKLRGPTGTVSTYALLDDASTVTLVESSMAARLGVTGPKQQMKLQWTNSIVKTVTTEVVQLHISGMDKKEEFLLTDVCTRENLDLPVQSVNIRKLAKTWSFLMKGQAAPMVNAEPTILIGQDNIHLMMPRKIIEGSGNGPVLTWTKLGWVVHGKVGNFKGRLDVALHMSRIEDEQLHQLITQSFSTEGFGVVPLQNLPQSKDDMRAQNIMDQTIRRVDSGWETGLLWKSDTVKLPESKTNAISRLRGMERKMDRDSEFGRQYCSKIEEYLQKGYIRKLSSERASVTTDKTWYLPHFAVTHPHKPGKLRLVFDAAAKSHGTSLNDALLSGPDKLIPLVSVLLKFRQRAIGFSGDIRDMFHRVKVRNEDTMSQRFLWRGLNRTQDPDTYEMVVMTFGATCSPCIAQEVKNRNALEFQEEFPEATRAITQRTYVDDYVDSTDDENSAAQRIQEVISIHSQGDFEIANWISSSKTVLERVSRIPAKSSLPITKCLNLDIAQLPTERVLGLHWNPNDDCFNFKLSLHKVKREIAEGDKRPTKREVLQLVASIFDPLGLISDFTIKARILMQDIWRSEIGWDDFVTITIHQKWKVWLDELKNIPKRSVPRCYSMRNTGDKNAQLHIFCDASEQAFASIAYLRIDKGGSVDVSLVMAKTRVAPTKPLSIPRLELQAAVMGSRLSKTIQDELEFDINTTHFWTDSSTVLRWLRSDARSYKPFVAHRVGEIMQLTDVRSWRWVPTEENVADEATRDSVKTDLGTNSRWLRGPSFLKLDESNWPKERQYTNKDLDNSMDVEMKSVPVLLMTELSRNLPDVNRFSSFLRLIRTTAWVPKLFKVWSSAKKYTILEELTPVEIHAAEKLWWKEVQAESFPEEIDALKNSKLLPSSGQLRNLTPFLDSDGVIRVRGRTEHSPELERDVKFPVILEPKHKFTRLLLMHYHLKFGHNGQETVANEVRQKYWVLHLRSAIRSTWNSCLKCRIERTKPKPPMMGAIPGFRLTRQVRPFIITGLDYFGPMTVQVGRRHEKRYGALFRCLNTSAVHIEIAHSLTTDSCIMAIRRFIARRGSPRSLYSDNGTNFRGADVELKKALLELDQEKMKLQMTTRGIDWHFIPPHAPHFGGCWERMVKAIKTALKSTLKERVVKEETLLTLLAEAEFTVNCHPLTFVSVDPADKESLTPNHFLLGSSSGNLAPGKFEKDDLSLRKQWRIAQQLADQFWRRWVKEYLPSLTRRQKWHQQVKPIAVGDLVLIADDNMERNYWSRGVVTATFPGKDGIPRVADVRTSKGDFRRPVTKLCILDIAEPEKKGTVSLWGEVCARRDT